jgi:hypothetical protein
MYSHYSFFCEKNDLTLKEMSNSTKHLNKKEITTKSLRCLSSSTPDRGAPLFLMAHLLDTIINDGLAI